MTVFKHIKHSYIASSLLFLLGSTSIAADEDFNIYNNSFRTTYETITLPNDESMGFMGINWLFNDDSGFYYGLGFYGAMAGHRGGFFTFGVECGYQYNLTDNILLDAGAFVGGGGGQRVVSGNGLMLRPHIGLLYDAKDYQMGIALSKVKFPGVFNSNQVGVQLDIPFKSLIVASSDTNIYHKLLNYNSPYDLGWKNYYFAMTFQQYFPTSKVKNDYGQKLTQTIGLVGAEAGRYLNDNWFAYFDTAGAASGGVGGYMDVFFGLGYDWKVANSFGLKVKGSAGSGGGGGIDTGGGVMYKTNVGAYYSPFKHVSVNVEAGYMDALNGNFSATTAKFSLAYSTDILGVGGNANKMGTYQSTTNNKWDIRLVNKHYLASSNIRHNRKNDPIDLIGFKLDRFLTPNFYITGQSDWAYAGYVGGYATGLLGIGYKTDYLFNKLSAYAELLAGAGAGGGVATKGGEIVQSMAGLTYQINQKFDFQIGIGCIKANSGTLNTTVIDSGFVYKFRTLEH